MKIEITLSEAITARNALAVQYTRRSKQIRAAQRRAREGKPPTRTGRPSELAMEAGEVKMLYDRMSKIVDDELARRRGDS